VLKSRADLIVRWHDLHGLFVFEIAVPSPADAFVLVLMNDSLRSMVSSCFFWLHEAHAHTHMPVVHRRDEELCFVLLWD